MATRPPVPVIAEDVKRWVPQAAKRINDISQGHTNNCTLVTLAANVTSTTITDDRITVDNGIFLQPTTANAATALATTYISETGRLNGSAVITHANTATTDRTFRVIFQG